MAMMLRELLPTHAGWDVKVLATDLSSRALAAARTGRYGARAVALASPEQLAQLKLAFGRLRLLAALWPTGPPYQKTKRGRRK